MPNLNMLDAKQELLGYFVSHKDVHDYLLGYPQSEWAPVLLTTLLYGIYSLKALHPSNMPLQALHEKMRRASALVNAEDLIPNIKEQLTQMRNDISNLEGQLDTRGQSQQINETIQNHSNFPPFQRKTLPETRITGNEKLSQGIYPDWWISLTKMDVKEKTEYSQKITERDPPPLPEPSRPRKVDFWNETQQETGTIKPEMAKWVEIEQNPQLSDKAIEANIESVSEESRKSSLRPSSKESSSRKPPIKKYVGWVGDFSDMVKKSPAKVEAEWESRRDSSMQSSPPEEVYRPSSRAIEEPTLRSSIMEKSSGRWAEASSSYTHSSMSQYNPSEEMKEFYRTEFNKFLDSAGSGSLESTLGHERKKVGEYVKPYFEETPSPMFKR